MVSSLAYVVCYMAAIFVLTFYPIFSLQGNLKTQSKYWLLCGIGSEIAYLVDIASQDFIGTNGYSKYDNDNWTIQLLWYIYLSFPYIACLVGLLLRLYQLIKSPDVYNYNTEYMEIELEIYLQSKPIKEIKGTYNLHFKSLQLKKKKNLLKGKKKIILMRTTWI